MTTKSLPTEEATMTINGRHLMPEQAMVMRLALDVFKQQLEHCLATAISNGMDTNAPNTLHVIEAVEALLQQPPQAANPNCAVLQVTLTEAQTRTLEDWLE